MMGSSQIVEELLIKLQTKQKYNLPLICMVIVFLRLSVSTIIKSQLFLCKTEFCPKLNYEQIFQLDDLKTQGVRDNSCFYGTVCSLGSIDVTTKTFPQIYS